MNGGEEVFGKIHYSNFYTNCQIVGSTELVDAVWVGENVTANGFKEGTAQAVSFDTGVKKARGNYTFKDVNVIRLIN